MVPARVPHLWYFHMYRTLVVPVGVPDRVVTCNVTRVLTPVTSARMPHTLVGAGEHVFHLKIKCTPVAPALVPDKVGTRSGTHTCDTYMFTIERRSGHVFPQTRAIKVRSSSNELLFIYLF